MDCIFCKIVKREIPAELLWENEHLVAFRDLNPQAPTHLLVIPKKHIRGIHEATQDDVEAIGQVLLGARDVAEKLGLHDGGYRLVINNGENAGQSVFHLHVHVLATGKLAWPPG